jgi:hypothetical protein
VLRPLEIKKTVFRFATKYKPRTKSDILFARDSALPGDEAECGGMVLEVAENQTPTMMV